MSFKGATILKRNTPSVKPVAGNPQQHTAPPPRERVTERNFWPRETRHYYKADPLRDVGPRLTRPSLGGSTRTREMIFD